jgi:hypothetical protein
MPRTNINFTDPSKAGTALPAAVAADVANGNVINNDGRVVVIASNANVSTIRNATVTPTATVDGLAAAARTSPIPASSSILLGPWEVGNYSTLLQLNGDNATDVKFQAIHFPG